MAIETREQFKAWLEGQPRAVCIAVAYRAAMRVLPLATRTTAYSGAQDVTLTAFRCSLAAGVAALGPTPDVMAAAAAAYPAADAARSAAYSARAYAASDAARAYSAAAYAAAYDDTNATVDAARVAAYSAETDAAASAAAYAAAYGDAELRPTDLPAAAIPVPDPIRAAIALEAEAADNALNLGGPWLFWAKWYARAMAGDPLPWDLQEQVALIPNEIWEAGPEAVAAEIERIEAAFLRERLPQSDRIVFDPDLALFRKETVPPAKPELLGATLASVGDALDDALAEPANGLTERSRETRVVRRMLDRYGNDPQRIEMDCTSAHRALTRQILTTEELPASEANLALQQALHEAAQGIRATHPEIAENRHILTEQALRELPEDADEALKQALPVLTAITDAALGTEFAEDILYLTEEMRAAPPRVLVAGERNPVLAGNDEKVRVFGRVAQMVLTIRSNGNAVLDRLEEKHRVTRGDLPSILVGLILFGVNIL